jgi:hypothetical protein
MEIFLIGFEAKSLRLEKSSLEGVLYNSSFGYLKTK